MNLFTQIKKSFPDMEKLLSEDELEEFKSCDENGLLKYHFGLGTAIRNQLLNEDGELYQTFLKCGMKQRDDMSFVMIKLFYEHLNRESRKIR